MISQHTVTAEVVLPDRSTVPLDVESVDLVMDETVNPYVRATLVCSIPSQRELVDPRTDARVRLRVVQAHGTGVTPSSLPGDVAALTATYGGSVANVTGALARPFGSQVIRSTRRRLDLSLRGRTVDHLAGTMTLDCASDEALLMDYALLSATPVTAGTTDVRAAVQYALDRIGAALMPGTATGAVEPDAVVWDPGVSGWDYVRALVEQAGLWLRCDHLRRWWLTAADELAPGSVTLTPIVVQARETLARDEAWYDGVVIRYEWTDAAGTQYVRYDVAGDATSSRVRRITRARPWPGRGAAAAALDFYRARGRVVTAEAVSRYDVEPTQALTLSLPDTPTQTGLVSSVTWRLPDDEMTVTSRDLIDTPDTSWLFTPPGIAWQDIPAGIDWTEYAYTGEVA